MVRIVHIMRGRVRMRMDLLKRRPGLAARLNAQLMGVSGVRGVRVKARTGSVLLSYDPGALGSAQFLDELCLAMGTLFPGHFSPGRLCVRVDLLKGKPRLAGKLQRRLAPISGIHRLEIDPSDGACLLDYDSRTVTSPEFIDAVSAPLAELLPWLDIRKMLSRVGLGKK
jgi:hypothetical protein